MVSKSAPAVERSGLTSVKQSSASAAAVVQDKARAVAGSSFSSSSPAAVNMKQQSFSSTLAVQGGKRVTPGSSPSKRKSNVEQQGVFDLDALLSGELARSPEAVFRRCLGRRSGYHERIQAQVFLSGPLAGEGPPQPTGLYVLEGKAFRDSSPKEQETLPVKHDEATGSHCMDQLFAWLMILQDPGRAGPSEYKIPAQAYNKIPMMCEQKKLFKCHPETGRLIEAERAINMLLGERKTVIGKNNIDADTESQNSKGGQKNQKNSKETPTSEAYQKAIRDLATDEDLNTRFPLPIDASRVELRWITPLAKRGDVVLYTNFHGNVSVREGPTCVQHIDYVPKELLRSLVREEFGVGMGHEAPLGTQGSQASQPNGTATPTKKRAVAPFTQLRHGGEITPLDARREWAVDQLCKALVSNYAQHFGAESSIADVGSGANRSGADVEMAYYRFKAGKGGGGGGKQGEELPTSSYYRFRAGGLPTSSTANLPPMPSTAIAALKGEKVHDDVSWFSQFDSWFHRLHRQGYLVVPAAALAGASLPALNSYYRDILNPAVEEAERLINFSLLQHNVPMKEVEKKPVDKEKQEQKLFVPLWRNAEQAKAAKEKPSDLHWIPDEPGTEDEKFALIRAALDKKEVVPLSFTRLRDARWNYFRSEEDRLALCGNSKVWYLKPSGGARFGNALLSRESGMGRIGNVYRNPALLKLQTCTPIRALMAGLYARMGQHAHLQECQRQGLRSTATGSWAGDGVIFVPERIRIKCPYGKLRTAGEESFYTKNHKKWHPNLCHQMPPHADKHLRST
ncbi:unnamed protein product [Amoebophrya sp. A25]|nr:unnamed protein product [Amoebophrya sp. A25]|eukprot:GSA25T00021425001.1